MISVYQKTILAGNRHIKHTGNMDFWSQSYLKTWFHGLYSTHNTGIGNKTLSETETQEHLNRQEE